MREHQADRPADHRRGAIAVAEHVEGRLHAQLETHRAIDDDQDRAAASAGGGSVQQELGRHIASRMAATTGKCAGWQPGEDGVDRGLLGRNRARPDRLDAYHLIGCQAAASRQDRTRSGVGATTGRPSVHPCSCKKSWAARSSFTSCLVD